MTLAPLTIDVGPRPGARVRVVGRGYRSGWAGTVTAVGPSRWDGSTVWLVLFDDGKRVGKARHLIQVVER